MTGAVPFRVIDTGIRGGRENVAFDQALIDARQQDRIPDTIRFLRFRPSVLIGMHQILGHEVRVEHCRGRDIEIGRRITGGGGLYLDEGQLGWELVFRRAHLNIFDLETAARRICEAAAAGLSKLGLPVRYRPRNDIEVEGRKIGGTGGYFDGDTLFYQGTLLIDFDPADMMAALKVPAAKLARHGLASAQQRIVTLREALGGRVPDLATIEQALLDGFAEQLGIAPARGAVTPFEEKHARHLFDTEIGQESFVTMLDTPESDAASRTASLTTPGGSIRADIRLEGPGLRRIREALITGDFFVTPPRAIFDLEAALRGASVENAGSVVEAFFARSPVEALTLDPGDIRRVVEAALRESATQAAEA